MLKPNPKVSQRESWWEKAQSFKHSFCLACWGLPLPTLSCCLHHSKTHSTQICIILSNHLSHYLEKLLSWNWSWKQRRDTKCLMTPDASLHKTSMSFITQKSLFQVSATEYWGACHHFWDADSAFSRNTILQHNTKEKESILHFIWGYSKSLPLSYKKSPLTSLLWAGKQGKERWGALDPVYRWGNRQGEPCYQLEGTSSSEGSPSTSQELEMVCSASENTIGLHEATHFVLFHEFKHDRK